MHKHGTPRRKDLNCLYRKLKGLPQSTASDNVRQFNGSEDLKH